MKNLLSIAVGEIGVKEVSGTASNPQILRYAQECGISNYTSDETAWCSLFMNWVAFRAGLEKTNSLLARSWLTVGVTVEDPEPGDVVIFWRGSKESKLGHVGIFLGYSMNGLRIYCLGGNQGNQVSITAKSANRLLMFKRLRPVQQSAVSLKNLRKGDTGEAVVKLQDALKLLGFNCGTSDGIFGSRTERCLKDFQATVPGLEASGILDEQTGDLLKQAIKKIEPTRS